MMAQVTEASSSVGLAWFASPATVFQYPFRLKLSELRLFVALAETINTKYCTPLS